MTASLNIPQMNTIQYSQLAWANTSNLKQVNFGSKPLPKSLFPDLKQYTIPTWGEYYCAPVSAANAIMNFAQKGFINLCPTNNSSILINELAKHFKTDTNGTTTKNMCEGLKSFVESKGYKANIEYKGFRDIDNRYKTTNSLDLNWINNEIKKENAVFLNIGVYKKIVENGKTTYTRQYGHYVNAIGDGNNGISNDKNYLTIHDPYNKVHGDHYIKTEQIKEGKFIHNKDDNEIALTNNAAGFYELSPKFNYFAKDEVGIINGVISLEIRK